MTHYIDKSAVIAEIDRIQNTTMDKNKNFTSSYDDGKFDALTLLENYIDTLEVKEEPISKNLEEAATNYIDKWYAMHNLNKENYPIDVEVSKADFKAGVQWQKEQMIDKACEWLKEQNEMVGVSFEEDFIERFKNYMKGE